MAVAATIQKLRQVSLGGTGTTSVAPSLTGVGVGNTLIAGVSSKVSSGSATPTGITSSPAQTWELAATGGAASTNGTDSQRATIWHALASSGANGGTGSTTVTVNFGASTTAYVTVAEFYGINSASAVDQTAANSGGGTGAQAPTVGPSGTTAQADEVVIACFGGNATSGTSAGLATPSGFTNLGVQQNGSTTNTAHSLDFKVVAATGTQSAAWGTIQTNIWWSTALATYKAAQTEIITTTGAGSWSTPADVTTVDKIEVWGGGGAGPRGTNRATGGGGWRLCVRRQYRGRVHSLVFDQHRWRRCHHGQRHCWRRQLGERLVQRGANARHPGRAR